ncbi:MAG: LysR family transcriptional regulator [Parvularcula sp.]|nr:LysR family transcriptional regulator [Parvularcula sp.]
MTKINQPSIDAMSRRLSLRHLRLIVAIAEEGNSVRAGNRINLSQPAVTKSLQEAEKLLEASLFERTNRGMMPTEYGAILLAHARVILSQVDKALIDLSNLKDGWVGQVSVGTLFAASANLLPHAISKLQSAHPRIRVKVYANSHDILLPLLIKGELDIVVGRLTQIRRQDNIIQEPLMDEIACAICAPNHPLAKLEAVTLKDLVREKWIFPDKDTTLRRQLDDAFRNEGLEPPGYFVESLSILNNLELILSAEYIGIVPWQTTRAQILYDRIRILPVPLKSTFTPIGITRRADIEPSPSVEKFIETLRAVAKVEPNQTLK